MKKPHHDIEMEVKGNTVEITGLLVIPKKEGLDATKAP